MARAIRDTDYITVGMGVSSVDGVTLLPILVDPTTGYLLMQIGDGTTPGAVSGVTRAKRDANNVTVKMGVASDTLLPQCLFVNSSGNLLIKNP